MLRARMGIRAHPTFLPMFGRSLLADFGGHVQTPVAGKGLYYVDFCGCWSTWADTSGRKGGGWGGIRTPGEREPTPVFKTGALNHSATHPSQ
jgi:hypothetical protein